jgi:hypothetical protein
VYAFRSIGTRHWERRSPSEGIQTTVGPAPSTWYAMVTSSLVRV